MARLRANHGEAPWRMGWLLVRRFPPQARWGERHGYAAQGVQRGTCSSKPVARALVYDGVDIVGWCQFGPPTEIPARMGGFRKLGEAPPDWRITCFFVDRDRRKEGVAEAALAGALRIIATKGGGTVDGYPIATRGKPYLSSFLFGGTESMFAEVGFRQLGALGTSKLVMRRLVRRRSASRA
jgi:hypothetical protein